MKFRKKPIEVEAWQIANDQLGDVPEWVVQATIDGEIQWREDFSGDSIVVMTLNGPVVGKFGDYVIKGTHDIYPVAKNVFEETYEKV